MGLDILPKAGINFKASYGAGNFKSKLNKLTSYQGGEFGMLRNNRQAIANAISKRAGAIRIKGGLDRMQRDAALAEIIKNDKTMTKEDKLKAKELLNYYARGNKPAASAIKPEIQRAGQEEPVKPRQFSHTSNPDFFRSGAQPGRFGAQPNRGDASRAALNYERMMRLGAGEEAGKLQKEAFAKFQQKSGGAGLSSLKPLK